MRTKCMQLQKSVQKVHKSHPIPRPLYYTPHSILNSYYLHHATHDEACMVMEKSVEILFLSSHSVPSFSHLSHFTLARLSSSSNFIIYFTPKNTIPTITRQNYGVCCYKGHLLNIFVHFPPLPALSNAS